MTRRLAFLSIFLLASMMSEVAWAQDSQLQTRVFEESSEFERSQFNGKVEYIRGLKFNCDGVDVVMGAYWIGALETSTWKRSQTYSLARKRTSPKTEVQLSSSLQHDTKNTSSMGLSFYKFALHFDVMKKRYILIERDLKQASSVVRNSVFSKVLDLLNTKRSVHLLAATKVAEGETYCFPKRVANQLFPFQFLKENQAEIDSVGLTRVYDNDQFASFKVVLQGSQRKESDALTKIRLYGKARIDKVSGRLVSLELRGSMEQSWAGSLASKNYQGTLTLSFSEKAP